MGELLQRIVIAGRALTKGCHSLNAAEQRELQTRMEKKQMKEFMTVSSLSSLPLLLPVTIGSLLSTCSAHFIVLIDL